MDIKFKMTLALGLTLVVLCKCRGGDCLPFELLDRAYCRTNTWNGCCVFENGQGTQFRKWEPPRNEIVSAIYAARHYVRYGKRTSVAASYYEVPVNEPLGASNAWRLNFNQFPTKLPDDIVIRDIDVPMANMKIRVLPFKVTNPESKSELYCVLVAFIHKGLFGFAVYVNVNDGRVSLDFHDVVIDGYTLIAHESRYPYLTPEECDIQGRVYVNQFRPDGEKPKNKTKEINSGGETNKCVPAKSPFNIETDVEISI